MSAAADMTVRPSLEWVPLDQLAIDARYQRSVEGKHARALIGSIVKGFDWRLMQCLTVARRADGSLWVIDGQHRLLALRQIRGIEQAPCLIMPAGTMADEARCFVASNRRRRAMTSIDRHRAALASGDATARDVEALVAAAGFAVAAHTNQTAWRPRQIGIVAGLERGLRNWSRGACEAALIALAEAWPGEVQTSAGVLFPSLAAFYHRALKDPAFQPDAFIAALASREQWRWVDDFRVCNRVENAGLTRAGYSVLQAAYARAIAPDADSVSPARG